VAKFSKKSNPKKIEKNITQSQPFIFTQHKKTIGAMPNGGKISVKSNETKDNIIICFLFDTIIYSIN